MIRLITFQGVVISLIRSTINIQRSCFRGGTTDFVVFVANDSTHNVEENFISNAISRRCETTGPRLFVEQPGSGCFLGNNECDGSCLELATQGSCLAPDVPTLSPTTEAPAVFTDSPIASPTMVVESMLPSFMPLDLGMPLTVPVTASPSPIESRTQLPTRIPIIHPSSRPTFTARPSVSPQPSSSPSISAAPSISIQPSTFPSFHPGTISEDRDRGKGSSSSKKKMMMGMMYNMKGMMTKKSSDVVDDSKSKKSGKGSTKQESAISSSKKSSGGKGGQNRIKRAFQHAGAMNDTIIELQAENYAIQSSTSSGHNPSGQDR